MSRPRHAVKKTGTAIKAIVLTVVLLGLLAATGGVVYTFVSSMGQVTFSDRCIASTSIQETTLNPEQARNASIIVGISVQRGLPERAATVAIATAYQESKLINIEYGDRDSLGLFQQRPSQGWGTPAQIMDPFYATEAFYDALVKVHGWQHMDVTVAAQAVQRSGFPNAYARHESNARAIAASMTGQTKASFTCMNKEPATEDATALVSFVAAVFGSKATASSAGQLTIVTPVDNKVGWAAAHVLVANAARYGITEIAWDSMSWSPDNQELGKWQDARAASETLDVTIGA